MKIVVTGGAGFIGSHLVESLLAAGHDVHVVDDLSTGRRSNIAHLLDNFRGCRLSACRVSDMPADGSWLDGVEQVYHLAAAVGVKLIVEQPVRSIENNVTQVATLLRQVADRKIPTLIASSSEVYGKSAKVPFCEDDDVVYGSTRFSRWSYAMSKALDEYLALAHYQTDGLPVVAARFFNTVGPGQSGQYGMVVPRFIAKALSNQPIEVYGDGRQTRCFCHVGDVTDALPKLLGRPECHGQVYNLGSDEEVSIADLADRVIAMTGSRAGRVNVPYDSAYGSGFDDLTRRVPDLTKIRAAIGFTPTKKLDDILRQLIRPAGNE